MELPVWQTGSAARGVDDLETGEELLVIGGRNQDEVEGQLPSVAKTSQCNAPLVHVSLQ